MKIAWTTHDNSGRHGLRAEVGTYDAVPPIDTYFFDGPPILNDPDRVAVAAVLLFGRYTSGALEAPDACSPATASAIVRYLEPAAVSVTPVSLEPRALPVGAGLCIVSEEGDEVTAPANAWGARRNFVLRSLRSDQYSGALASMSTLDIATNGWLHARTGDVGLTRRAASIALAVLYAETLQFDEIAVPTTKVDPNSLRRTRDLLASVRLGFALLGDDLGTTES